MDYKIDKRVQEIFEKGHLENDSEFININSNIKKKLLPYQNLHVFNMISALMNNRVVIDGSYTGTGKTYTTIAACAQLKLRPFIICPKSVINVWKQVCLFFNVEPISVVNYELIKNCMVYDNNGNHIKCEYLNFLKENNCYEWNFDKIRNNKNDNKNTFKKHKQLNNVVLVFDEVHKCKNSKTKNGLLLLSAKTERAIMLSATLCDKISDFGIYGMLLGFYKNPRQGRGWIESIIREDSKKIGSKKTNTLHEYLFPSKGSRMALEDLGDKFPMNQISIECYTLNTNSIKKVNDEFKKISNYNEDNTIKFSLITKLREIIENQKISIIIDLFEDYYEQNKSIAIFLNYLSSYAIITEYLSNKKIDYSEINGSQDIDTRQKEINKFQNNETRVIVSMIQAGGTGLSLDDKNGNYPRVSLISPSYSSIELLQCLGRIHRSSSKSPCLQKIIFCSNTYEENICRILRSKNNLLSTMTDEDFQI